MDQLLNGLIEKVGLSKETAEKVVAFLQQHASQVPEWLGSDQVKDLAKKLPGGLGGMFD